MHTLPVCRSNDSRIWLTHVNDSCHWTEAELGQNKTLKVGTKHTLKIITEITKKQTAPFLTHLSVIREEIFIIYKVNNTINTSHL